jgi:hypothetical protein
VEQEAGHPKVVTHCCVWSVLAYVLGVGWTITYSQYHCRDRPGTPTGRA